MKFMPKEKRRVVAADGSALPQIRIALPSTPSRLKAVKSQLQPCIRPVSGLLACQYRAAFPNRGSVARRV
jgi:hypothetical protein